MRRKKLNVEGYHNMKKFYYMFSRFYTIHERDRQRYRQTATPRWHNIATGRPRCDYEFRPLKMQFSSVYYIVAI